MSESESKHDKILKRAHLWIAVLGGFVGLLIGLYNFKSIFFPAKEKQVQDHALNLSSGAELGKIAVSPPLLSASTKIRQYEWKGPPEDFVLLDLDSNGILNAQDLKGADFENIDRNGDGFAERLEWRKSRRAFDMLDGDGDGKVSRQEFAQHERALRRMSARSSGGS